MYIPGVSVLSTIYLHLTITKKILDLLIDHLISHHFSQKKANKAEPITILLSKEISQVCSGRSADSFNWSIICFQFVVWIG